MATPLTAPRMPYTLEVWCDLQCPDCTGALPILDGLDLRDPSGAAAAPVLRHYPLPHHTWGVAAAQLALAHEARTGSPWPMARALLGLVTDGRRPGLDDLVDAAVAVGLTDAARVLESGAHALTVAEEVAAGRRLGVKGTPTFVLSGDFATVMVSANRTLTGAQASLRAVLATLHN